MASRTASRRSTWRALAPHYASGAAVTAVVHRELALGLSQPGRVYVFERAPSNTSAWFGHQGEPDPGAAPRRWRVVAHVSEGFCPTSSTPRPISPSTTGWSNGSSADGAWAASCTRRVGGPGGAPGGPVLRGRRPRRGEATLIGPTSIGCGSVVGPDALLAARCVGRCLVGGSVVHGCVWERRRGAPRPGCSTWCGRSGGPRRARSSPRPAFRGAFPFSAVLARHRLRTLVRPSPSFSTRPRYWTAPRACVLLLAPLGPATVLRYLGEGSPRPATPGSRSRRLRARARLRAGWKTPERAWTPSSPPVTSPAGSPSTSPRTGSSSWIPAARPRWGWTAVP